MKYIDLHDRIMEAYYGLMGEKFMKETQQRINYIGKKVYGEEILDIGCSQGILPILLGREGKRVIGIDVSKKAIDEAKHYLSKEEQSTQNLVTFMQGEFINSHFDRRFDTVILAEVLEHLLNPERFIQKAKELLVTNGKLIVTIPFGINDYIDHKKTYYFIDMYEMLSNYFNIENIKFFDKWIIFEAINREFIKDFDTLKGYIYRLERSFYNRERELLTKNTLQYNTIQDSRDRCNQLEAERELLTKRLKKVEKRLKRVKRAETLLQDNLNRFKWDNQELNKTIDKLKREKDIISQNVKKAYDSVSFRVGYEVIQATKSWKRFVMLPKRIWEIKKDRELKRRVSGTINQTIKMERNKFDNRLKGCKNNIKLKKGISVITPSYQSQRYISTFLNSLGNQTFPKNKFEIIIILNGKLDKSKEIIEEFKAEYLDLNIIIEIEERADVSLARNRGIELAKFEYSIFIDDDDWVSPNYLAEIYPLCERNSIVITQIVDVSIDGRESSSNMNMEILFASSRVRENYFIEISSVLTINGSKAIPTCYLKSIKFNEGLKNGEDVIYFSKLLSTYRLDAKIARKAIYYRLLKKNSISRQTMSYEFNIIQRLAVIKELNNVLKEALSSSAVEFVKKKIEAQTIFMNNYLLIYPDTYSKIQNEILKANLSYFPFFKLNRGLSKDLVVSYCFTPYIDTSAIVMAKRIRENGRVVDVVYNKMDKVRDIDKDLYKLADDLIENRILINSPTSFSNYKAIDEFVKKGLAKLNGKYNRVYSRALWSGSHFLAYGYKSSYPEVEWIAEFSDPILYDIFGKERYSKIKIDKQLKSYSRSDNLFFWVEYLPYLFADKIIFTNRNQLDYMLSNFPVKGIGEKVMKKAIIKEQPTLPYRFYNLVQSDYPISKKRINFAYFGTFYATRRLDNLIYLMKKLDSELKEKILFHIFTNSPKDVRLDIERSGFNKYFKVNPYVGYFEFLNISTKMDILIINDATTDKKINPYLPSKLSDYIGSGKDIWALYEKGSILSSKSNIKYCSELNNIEESISVIREIIGNSFKSN
jgi:SAM-dependent methyltransferase/glycosyltransferase involved in cell wall biosynthesis